MKIKHLVSICLALCLAFAFSTSSHATDVHSSGRSVVDNGEIRWEGSNWYASDRSAAIDSWNDLNPINILPDTSWLVSDVVMSDVNRSDVTWAGRYNYPSGNIQINNYFLDQYDSNKRVNVFAHELGHALGIGDHTDTICLMYESVLGYPGPQAHDIKDYNALWN